MGEGEIKIIRKWRETRGDTISVKDAWEEGQYSPDEYERLYEEMHPNWKERWAYEFRFDGWTPVRPRKDCPLRDPGDEMCEECDGLSFKDCARLFTIYVGLLNQK